MWVRRDKFKQLNLVEKDFYLPIFSYRMSKKEKLLQKLVGDSQITWNEVVTLMNQLGFELVEREESRFAFKNGEFEYFDHKPHEKDFPKTKKKYLVNFLKERNLI